MFSKFSLGVETGCEKICGRLFWDRETDVKSWVAENASTGLKKAGKWKGPG